ncbi:MAG: c-type cytochrome [Methylococcales bacterium]
MRKIFKKALLTAGFVAMACGGSVQAAGDPIKGKILFEGCAGCHGRPGYTNAFPRYHVPLVAGQSGAYTVAALTAYAAGNRNHMSMEGNALSLTEENRVHIGAYLEGFKLTKVSHEITGNPKAGKKKAASCAGCHGGKGVGSDKNYPHLAGQYESYLVHAINQYKSGKRKSPIMTGMVSSLTEEDILDIAAFYANQKKGLPVFSR